MWYTFSISARCSSSTPFGRPVVPPVYISTTGSSSSGSSGVDGGARLDQVLVAEVVGHVAIADQHDVAEREVGTDVGDVAREVIGEHGVDEDHLGAGVGQDCLQLPAGKAQVQRCDDATAEERRVVQLEVLVAVARHDREPIVPIESELVAHAVGEAEHAVGVFARTWRGRRRRGNPTRDPHRSTAGKNNRENTNSFMIRSMAVTRRVRVEGPMSSVTVPAGTSTPGSGPGQYHLEGPGLAGVGEHVVGLF